MPLPFRSKSHGVVAFGFFNVECDLLLLERRFFFADDFCRAVQALAAGGEAVVRVGLSGWRIDDPRQVGDLMGAIRGTDLSGFLGATYARFPFPADPAAFKQQPVGALGRQEATALVAAFGAADEFALVWEGEAREVAVAEVVFEERRFGELLAYVRRGGYPRWQDDAPPEYVREFLARLDVLDPPFAP